MAKSRGGGFPAAGLKVLRAVETVSSERCRKQLQAEKQPHLLLIPQFLLKGGSRSIARNRRKNE